ncbi:unnamed protein product [Bathycoccus prasinos]
MSFASTSIQSSSLLFSTRSSSSFKKTTNPKSSARRSSLKVSASAEADAAKIKVTDVKETLGRGFILVDIRSPEEVAETGNPNFLALIKNKFPNSMSRILLACDDGTFRSELAHKLITQKLGYSQVKIIEGGIDAYIEFQPLTKEDKIKVRMVAQAGNDLSMLVSGVDTRQAGQKLY